MCDQKDDDMFVTETQLLHLSSRRDHKGTKQERLNAISSSIDISKLPKTKPLSFKENAQVDIDPSHPDYNYWVRDDD